MTGLIQHVERKHDVYAADPVDDLCDMQIRAHAADGHGLLFHDPAAPAEQGIHFLQGFIGSLGQILIKTECDDVGLRESDRAVQEALRAAEPERYFTEGTFYRGTPGFTVPLRGVTVADREETARMGNRQIRHRSGAQLPAVQVSPMGTRNVCADRLITQWRDSEHSREGICRNTKTADVCAVTVRYVPDPEVFLSVKTQMFQVIRIADADAAPPPGSGLNVKNLYFQRVSLLYAFHMERTAEGVTDISFRIPLSKERCLQRNWIRSGNTPVSLKCFNVQDIA